MHFFLFLFFNIKKINSCLWVNSIGDPGDVWRNSSVHIRPADSTSTSTDEGSNTKLSSVACLDQRTTGISLACTTSGTNNGTDLRLGNQRTPLGCAVSVRNGVSGQVLEIVWKWSVRDGPTPTDQDCCNCAGISSIQWGLRDSAAHSESLRQSNDGDIIGEGLGVVVCVEDDPCRTAAYTSGVQSVSTGYGNCVSCCTANIKNQIM